MALQFNGPFGYRLLRRLSRRPAAQPAEDSPPAGPQGAEKLQRLFGFEVWNEFTAHRVLDFGCGHGIEAVAVAQRGARHVYGIDIQEHRLKAARHLAQAQGVADRCVFLNAATEVDSIAELEGTIDCAYSLDAFEHYGRPDLVLKRLHELLAPGGRLWIAFGPPWKHPYGCHMRYFCRWPWIHLLFAEETILAVRSEFRDDGARRFEDVEGGLNRMTLARFQELIAASPFDLELLRPIPLSSRFAAGPQFWQPLFTNRLAREYFTSVVLCRLRKPALVDTDLCEPAEELMASS
jgi:SAM-dependent methyltransferase